MTRILLVGPEDPRCCAAGEYLGMALGYEVDHAEKRQEVRALCTRTRYDVAIVHEDLGEGHHADGFVILADLHGWCPWTRLILVARVAIDGLTEVTANLGLARVLHEPSPHELRDTVHAVLSDARLSDEHLARNGRVDASSS